jgi:signal transduction histidine kinase
MLMAATGSSKRATIVILRWVLIIAFSYLLIVDPAAHLVPGWVGLLIAGALGSNLIVSRLPEEWFERRVVDFGIVLFDALWVTLGLSWAPNVSGDLFLLYFLVIFVAAVGESLPMIVGSAVVVALAYGAMLSLHGTDAPPITATTLLRVPFLFVVALFYGYFVTQIRGKRNEATEARLRDQAKTELLAAVSHDLRNPLGNAENLLALAIEAQAEGQEVDRTLLMRAQVNVRRVSSLVVNLLQAATIEAGRVHFQMTLCQLNDVVDDVVSLAGGEAQLKGVGLHCEIDPALPEVVADHLQLSRIVMNLVDNAIKYSPAGGSVTVRTHAESDTVTVEVEDAGPGLSPEQCATLFAPYQRTTLSTYKPGTGLGLYIVKRLAEAQGGTVSLRSHVGEGSIFAVSFSCSLGFSRDRLGRERDQHGVLPAVPVAPENLPAEAA